MDLVTLLIVLLIQCSSAVASTSWKSLYGGTTQPDYAGLRSFAGLPWVPCVENEAAKFDVAILGMPFDGKVSFRPGARFGPQAIRQASRRQRPGQGSVHSGVHPYQSALQFVDCDDLPLSPYDTELALDQMQVGYTELLGRSSQKDDTSIAKIITLGGDHSIVLPILRSLHSRYGPVAVVHFDAHMDTWAVTKSAGTLTEQSQITHGSFLWKASEEGLIDQTACIHAGLRSRLNTRKDREHDAKVGFERILTAGIDTIGVVGIAKKIKARVGNKPVYLSIDIDTLDPAFAPGTGTLETGGWSTRELHQIIRSLRGMNFIGMDIVEVSPPFDHAEITAYAASDLVFEFADLLVAAQSSTSGKPLHEEL